MRLRLLEMLTWCRHHRHKTRVQHGYDWQTRSDLAQTFAPWSHGQGNVR
jgi:hypothetical protein